MFRSFLSWRYLVSRRTNLIGVAGLFLGVAVPILILSIMSGFLDGQRQLLRGDLADVVIEPRFGATGGGARIEQAPEPLLELVRADERVAHAAARLSWHAIVSLAGDDAQADVTVAMLSGESAHFSAVEMAGVDLLVADRVALDTISRWLRVRGFPTDLRIEGELEATDLYEALAAEPNLGSRVSDPLFPFRPPARYRPRGRRKSGIVLGDRLFWTLGVSRGSIVSLATVVPDRVTGESVGATREFVVTGSFRTGFREIDTGRVLIERSELADFLGDGREFSEVLVQLEDYERDREEVVPDLLAAGARAGLLRGLEGEVQTWEQRKGAILRAIRNERVMMGIMLSLVLVVAGFTIFAILSMLVTEKRRDIGILTALGATPRGILQTFLMIGLWDAVIGALLGAAAGVWASLEIDTLERFLAETFGIEIFNRSIFAFDHIPSRLEPLGVALMVLLAFACALVFAAIPAWRAARLDPLEALRYE